jgi:hypothetical protein
MTTKWKEIDLNIALEIFCACSWWIASLKVEQSNNEQ